MATIQEPCETGFVNIDLIHQFAELRHLPGSWLWQMEARLRGVEIGGESHLVGRPIIRRYPGSTIHLGTGVKIYSKLNSNPLGLARPCVIRTLTSKALIEMGARSGISGGVICAGLSVIIGEDTLIGAGAMVLDNDFHRFQDGRWRNDFDSNAKPIRIGNGVFVGAQAIILKGVSIGDGATVGAGAIVTRDVSPGVIVAGNPAVVVGSNCRNNAIS